ncbi:MAG: hypothetical protein QXV81_07760 [Ignisphaera sp.]|uniref:Uncharacterized protein n=1 Tax=Ignisphaera aggregans TaxID=334771 RepID=A0A7J3I6K9_9CREN
MASRYATFTEIVILSSTAAMLYALLVAIVSLLLSFPGFGPVILPQPFLQLYVGRWTISYRFDGLWTIVWIIYLLAIHILLYYLTASLFKLRRPFIVISILLYLLNLIMVLYGYSDVELRLYVERYTIGYLGLLPGIGATILIEYLGYRIGKTLLPKISSKSNLHSTRLQKSFAL